MDVANQKKAFAWQPFTFSGVAAFGDATYGRLLAVQFFFAALVAATVVWLLQLCWFPVVREAIRHLPGTGEIRSAKLVWPGESPVALAQNRFVAITVDLKHQGQARSPAHVQLEFGEKDLKIISLLGFVRVGYPSGWIIPCNRDELLPWWGAWSPMLLAVAALAVLMGFFIFWTVMALILFIPIWTAGLFEDRALTMGGAWRMAGASQMPGALLLIVALFFYGLHAVDPVRLLAAVGVQTLMLFIYAFGSPVRRPKIGEKKINPFETKPLISPTPVRPENPFGPPVPSAPPAPTNKTDDQSPPAQPSQTEAQGLHPDDPKKG